MERGFKMSSKDNSEILELRSIIERISPIIEKQSKMQTENTNFSEIFANSMNNAALNNRKNKCQELLEKEQKEIFELHITGKNIGKGTGTLAPLSDFLLNLQKFFDKTAQSLNMNANLTVNKIKLISKLQLEAIETGSIKIILSGNIPHKNLNLFDENENDLSNNLFTKTVSTIFDILEQKDIDKIYDKISSIKDFPLSAYINFINSIINGKLSVSGCWQPMSGSMRRYMCSDIELKKIIPSFYERSTYKTENITLNGIFISINANTNQFVFKVEDGKIIKGNFSKDTKEQLKNLHISPLNEQPYQVIFIKEISISKRNTNINWILLEAVILNK